MPKRNWIKIALDAQGYRQRDLAEAWGVSEASVTRFLQGTENPDPSFSKCIKLAEMCGMTLDELAARMGLKGKVPPPLQAPATTDMLRLGDIRQTPIPGGMLRTLIYMDLPVTVAANIIRVIGGEPPTGMEAPRLPGPVQQPA